MGDIENLGDLERLRLVLEYMPDEELMQKLEKEEEKVEMIISKGNHGIQF